MGRALQQFSPAGSNTSSSDLGNVQTGLKTTQHTIPVVKLVKIDGQTSVNDNEIVNHDAKGKFYSDNLL